MSISKAFTKKARDSFSKLASPRKDLAISKDILASPSRVRSGDKEFKAKNVIGSRNISIEVLKWIAGLDEAEREKVLAHPTLSDIINSPRPAAAKVKKETAKNVPVDIASLLDQDSIPSQQLGYLYIKLVDLVIPVENADSTKPREYKCRISAGKQYDVTANGLNTIKFDKQFLFEVFSQFTLKFTIFEIDEQNRESLLSTFSVDLNTYSTNIKTAQHSLPSIHDSNSIIGTITFQIAIRVQNEAEIKDIPAEFVGNLSVQRSNGVSYIWEMQTVQVKGNKLLFYYGDQRRGSYVLEPTTTIRKATVDEGMPSFCLVLTSKEASPLYVLPANKAEMTQWLEFLKAKLQKK